MPRSKSRALDPEHVRAAAIGIASDEGLAAVDLAAVSERLQVPRKALTALDVDERAMVADAFSRVVAAELADLQRTVDEHEQPLEQLAAVLAALAEPARVEVDAMWVDAWSLGRRNPLLGAAVRQEEDAWHALLAAVIRRGSDSGAFRRVDADEVALRLLAVVDGLTAQAIVGWDDGTDRRRLLAGFAGAELGVALDGAAAS